jgi:hypothetical protein
MLWIDMLKDVLSITPKPSPYYTYLVHTEWSKSLYEPDDYESYK